ncbi:MAG: two pore domain potassium channel family protein [Thermoleophilaceae bacterium]|nr:two pore domain potassium channel family protein [Thermoleophilaceae bacterium]
MTAAGVLATVVGLGAIGVACRDIFDSLFHPEGRARIGRTVSRAVWLMVRRPARGRPGALALAGPLAMIAVIATWALLLVTGWALVYLPHVDDGFRVAGRAGGGDLVDALNISLVTLTTLGFGDVTPEAAWLRLVNPLEALLGFGLLSASVSWLLLTYPVLSRRRSLAYEVSLLRRQQEETGASVVELDPAVAERVFAELTSRLVAVERDFVNFPITYYFVEADERFSLAAAAPHLLDLAERGSAQGRPEPVRLRARLLGEALGDLAATTSSGFHGARGDSTAELLRHYARDQLRG